MDRSPERLKSIYSRTSGKCHICHKQLAFCNYGSQGARGAWEIEHSKPRNKGGTDHLNNLYAAHIGCNRSKQDGSNYLARKQYGQTRAPFSVKKEAVILQKKKTKRFIFTGLAVVTVGALIAGPVGAALGLKIASSQS